MRCWGRGTSKQTKKEKKNPCLVAYIAVGDFRLHFNVLAMTMQSPRPKSLLMSSFLKLDLPYIEFFLNLCQYITICIIDEERN